MKTRLSTRLLAQLRLVVLFIACITCFSGCAFQSASGLDAADLRFAAFYSDYLLQSGTLDDTGTLSAVSITSSGMDSLFAMHGLDQATFNNKLKRYSQDPELWRKVLLQVRKNLRHQNR